MPHQDTDGAAAAGEQQGGGGGLAAGTAAAAGQPQPQPGNAHLDFVQVPPERLHALIANAPPGSFVLRKAWPGVEGAGLRCCTLFSVQGGGVQPVGDAGGGGGEEWLVRMRIQGLLSQLACIPAMQLRAVCDGGLTKQPSHVCLPPLAAVPAGRRLSLACANLRPTRLPTHPVNAGGARV